MVVVLAEPGVAAEAQSLDVRVSGGAGSMLGPRVDEAVGTPLTPVRFPVSIALVPAGGDPSRRFAVEMTARSPTGADVARARVLSSFVEGRTLRLEVLLEDCCRAIACEATQTCRGCACATADVPPEDLPDFVADAGPPDAGAPIDAPIDAPPPPRCPGGCYVLEPFVGGVGFAPWPRDQTWAPPIGSCPAKGTAPTADYGYGSFLVINDDPVPRTVRLTTMRLDPELDLALVVYDWPTDMNALAQLPPDPLACRALDDDAPGLAPDAQLEVTIAPRASILVVLTRATPGPLGATPVQVHIEIVGP
jgi:hypothetical protein